jgi:glycosyltransferase A (GT-A) superfamily protein (DUF2064 family)
MSPQPAAVLIMAPAPRKGQVRLALEPVLGADGAVALHAALIAQAAAWAHEVAPGQVYVAHDPPDSAPELRELVGDATVFPQNGNGIAGRVAEAVGRVFARREGPLLVTWPDLPRLRLELASAAVGDLEDGCDLSLGPVIDGGFYLVGISRAIPELFALSEQAWRSSDAMTLAAAAGRDAGLEIGILRAERGLQRPADVRAALADPLLPDAIRRILVRGSAAGGRVAG